MPIYKLAIIKDIIKNLKIVRIKRIVLFTHFCEYFCQTKLKLFNRFNFISAFRKQFDEKLMCFFQKNFLISKVLYIKALRRESVKNGDCSGNWVSSLRETSRFSFKLYRFLKFEHCQIEHSNEFDNFQTPKSPKSANLLIYICSEHQKSFFR